MARWTVADMPKMQGRTVLVTGANAGLGLATARAIAAAGAQVVLGCRNAEKAAAARDEVAAISAGDAPTVVQLDLADLGSVRACAEQVADEVGALDGLVNNAGVMAIPEARTADGFEMQFGTNHLGHFALTGLLLPALLRSPSPRVVTVSSIAHWSGRMRWDDLNAEKGYNRWTAYGQSKLANLLFSGALARRATDTALVAVAAHPGIVPTKLYSSARISRLGATVTGHDEERGALPQVRALVDPDARPNDYFGPMLEFRGSPRRVWRSPVARRRSAAERLWSMSEELTGVVPEFTA